MGPVRPWIASNDATARAGGWRTYAREAARDAAAPTVTPSGVHGSPATGETTGRAVTSERFCTCAPLVIRAARSRAASIGIGSGDAASLIVLVAVKTTRPASPEMCRKWHANSAASASKPPVPTTIAGPSRRGLRACWHSRSVRMRGSGRAAQQSRFCRHAGRTRRRRCRLMEASRLPNPGLTISRPRSGANLEIEALHYSLARLLVLLLLKRTEEARFGADAAGGRRVDVDAGLGDTQRRGFRPLRQPKSARYLSHR